MRAGRNAAERRAERVAAAPDLLPGLRRHPSVSRDKNERPVQRHPTFPHPLVTSEIRLANVLGIEGKISSKLDLNKFALESYRLPAFVFHEHPLHPAALAFLSYECVLVRFQIPGFCIPESRGYGNKSSRRGEARRRPIQTPVKQQNHFPCSQLTSARSLCSAGLHLAIGGLSMCLC